MGTHQGRSLRQLHHDPADRPFMVIWEVTRACDLACRHCRAEARPDRDPAELSTEEGVVLLEQVASFGRPPPLVVMTGGDPFKRPDLFELVAHAAALRLPVAVSPSGTPNLEERNLRRLKESGASAVSLSVDGSSAALHDGFRGAPGVFGWTLRAWRTTRDLGFKVQINTTVTAENAGDLPAILGLVRGLGAMTWSVFLLVPMGRGIRLPALSPRDVEDVLNFLYEAGKLVSVKTTEGQHFRRVVLQRLVLERRGLDPVPVLGLGELYLRLRAGLHAVAEAGEDELPGIRRAPLLVNAGSGFVFVSHVGAVLPSGFLPLPAGNVRLRPLPEIYRESPLFLALRDPDRLTGRCGACEFRAVCGGSRSRAFAVTGDPLAEEPWCAYVPGTFPFEQDVRELLDGARSLAQGG